MSVTKDTYQWLETAYKKGYQSSSKEDLLDKVELVRTLLNEELDEFIQALENKDKLEMINACSDLLFVATNLPFFAGFTHNQLELSNIQVFESNMTKFCKNEKEALDSCLAYSLGEHPNKKGTIIYTQPVKTEHEKLKYRVERVSDGKLLKSIAFEDVNEEYINEVLTDYKIPE